MYLNLSSNCIKGIHNETKITREEFLKCLYENKPIDKEQTRLRRDLTKFKFCVVKEQKKALNALYYKMKVSDDFLSVKPY